MAEPREDLRFSTQSLDALRERLRASPRAFSLNLAVYPDPPVRDHVLALLREEFRAIEEITLRPSYAGDVFGQVFRAVPPGPHDAIFIFGLDELARQRSNTEPLFRDLDRSPRRWKAWYPHPLVFWVDALAADIVRTHARDFWEWQTNVFDLEQGP